MLRNPRELRTEDAIIRPARRDDCCPRAVQKPQVFWIGIWAFGESGRRRRRDAACLRMPATSSISGMPPASGPPFPERDDRPYRGAFDRSIAWRWKRSGRRLPMGTATSTCMTGRISIRSMRASPAGTLIELASDGPGFALDEPPEALGAPCSFPNTSSGTTTISCRLPQFGLPGEPRIIYRDLPFVHRIRTKPMWRMVRR